MPRRKLGGNLSSGNAKVAPALGFQEFSGPKGVYQGVMKQLALGESKAGDDMLKYVWECAETGERAEYNGQSIWDRRLLTDQFAARANGFLVALGCSPADIAVFWDTSPKGGPMVDTKKDSQGYQLITAIGKFKINPDGMPLIVSVGMGKASTDPATGNIYEAKMEIKSFLLPEGDAPRPTPEPDDDEDEEPISDATASDEEPEADEEEATEEADEATEEADDDPAFTARAAELEAMKRPALVKIAKVDLGLRPLTRHSDDEIIDMILAAEFPPLEDEETEEETEAVEEESSAATAPARTTRTKPARKPATAVSDDEPPF